MSKGDNIRYVTSTELSNKIIANAQVDSSLGISLVGCNDLLAMKAKYHLSCLSRFKRNFSKNDQDVQQADSCLEIICAELLQGLAGENVFHMADVWSKYISACKNEHHVNVPAKYSSRPKKNYLMIFKQR